MKLLKPQKLEKGDTIALLSPSSGLAHLFPHRLNNAIKFFKSLGFEIKEFHTTRKLHGWSAAPAEERAMDLIRAFEDPSIKAIICTIGGLTSNQLLKYIDFTAIKKNPKIFCGYSDISVLHYAFYTKTRLVTFYGPAAMTQFGEYPKPLKYTIDYFFKAVTIDKPIGRIIPSKEWTDEFLDWSKKTDLYGPRTLKQNKGFEWLTDGKATGPIIGGCISSLIHLRGTEYWPNHKNKILFLEIPEGQDTKKGQPLPYIDAYLTDFELSGVFDEISGLIFGRPYSYTEKDKIKLKEILYALAEKYSFPILFGADIGHTDPMITIPIGVNVTLDSINKIFSINESGVI